MPRYVFFSFHYRPDNWRASQVRNIGAIDGNKAASDNDWEEITSGGDAAIERWIENQLKGRSCVVVLIGANTSGRKWIKHEIRRAWTLGKGVLGVFVHNLKDADGNTAIKGANPFADFRVGGTNMSEIVKAYDPPYTTSTNVYNHIKENIEDWIETAISIRREYG
jgi:hypothetical protein